MAGLSWNRLAAMPFAVIAFLIVLYFAVDMSATDSATHIVWFPDIEFVPPVFSIQAMVSVAVPLYLVTMAGQNIPGFTVLELNKYAVDRPPLIRKTGFVSLLIAPFGAIPVNMSAITAAMMAGEDAGRDPKVRYWAAIVSGIVYVALAFAAGVITTLAGLAPAALITGVAGLALIPAFVASVSAAFSDQNQLEAPALTFLISGSGMVLLGVSGAFWGVLAGAAVWYLKGFGRQN